MHYTPSRCVCNYSAMRAVQTLGHGEKVKHKQTTILSFVKRPNNQNKVSEKAQSEWTEATADSWKTHNHELIIRD